MEWNRKKERKKLEASQFSNFDSSPDFMMLKRRIPVTSD